MTGRVLLLREDKDGNKHMSYCYTLRRLCFEHSSLNSAGFTTSACLGCKTEQNVLCLHVASEKVELLCRSRGLASEKVELLCRYRGLVLTVVVVLRVLPATKGTLQN